MTAKRTFLLASLAMNQTVFFEALGQALEKEGERAAYLCFHERSHDHLVARGRRSFNAFREGAGTDDQVDLASYAWPSLNLALSHEKAAFELDATALLVRKLKRYLAASESTLEALEEECGAQVVVVQELGGFVSNVASFYAARRRGFDNVFIEPAFFRGRVCFVRNQFGAHRVSGPDSPQVSDEVSSYLDDSLARQRVVIPDKDAHHYRGPIRKLTDARNLRRLVEKFADKHLFGKSEEFAHISGHVARHVRMFANSRLLSGRYRPLPESGRRFVYYPLHVPADVALTIRSPQYLDQCALVDFIARCVPQDVEVLIKEHPALVGAIDRRRILQLLRTRDNVRLLDPHINNYEVMKRAAAVVTVNSKSGAEALLLGRPVIVLGDAFYTDCRLVRKVDSLGGLPAALADTLRAPLTLDMDAVRRYFEDVWRASWPGELYVADPANVAAFASSLLKILVAPPAR